MIHLLLYADSPWGWLPPNVNSAYGGDVDWLYFLILALTSFVFAITEGLLLYFCFRYREKQGGKVRYSHGSNKAELAWTITPALVLVWLAFIQLDTWNLVKDHFPFQDQAHMRRFGVNDPTRIAGETIQVMAEQFAWNFRYRGDDGLWGEPKRGTVDDIATMVECWVPVNEKVLFHMSSKDVIHSFFVPFARSKQDTMPGMMTKTWFVLDKIPVWKLSTQGEGYAMELVDEATFATMKVAISGYFLDADEKGNGKRHYHYELEDPKDPSITYVLQGKKYQGKAGDATHVLHYLEIACAELCGIGHTNMGGQMYVAPRWLLNDWKAQRQQEGSDLSAWLDWWDKYHPEYNLQGDSLQPQTEPAHSVE